MDAEQVNNPYVGPRTFPRADSPWFFGRSQEARDLLARVVSERLLLFYAQSGAGKSSLVNTRLIPGLEQQGFVVLPTARVGGELPAGVDGVDNIYLFSLLYSVNNAGKDPAALAHLSLSECLARLASEDGEHWCYDPAASPATAIEGGQPYVLIVDQFEELLTTHPGRWEERGPFFVELDRAMTADPNLWVVLVSREDYVAALDPYARFMANKLRARYYMERMGIAEALEAVRCPAELGGRPFAPGVAEELVDNLRRVRVAGSAELQLGQYVEPVQLQVVCHQLWASLSGRPLASITRDDLPLDYIDHALTRFYEDALATALADPDVQAGQVDEAGLRSWFSRKLITPAGTARQPLRRRGAAHDRGHGERGSAGAQPAVPAAQ